MNNAPLSNKDSWLPVDQTSHGFKPTWGVRVLRGIARALIDLFGLHGRSRWSNEFIQMLDPRVRTTLSDGSQIEYRTGHGRLFWRALEPEGDEPLMDRWLEGFNQETVFWDIGACVGTYSMRAAMKGAKVVAFEADILNASIMAENLRFNNLEEIVTLVPVPLDEETGKNIFFRRDAGSPGHALHSVAQPSQYIDTFIGSKVPVVTVSTDDAARIWDLPSPTHVKIDVDNNELRILKGAEGLLRTVTSIYVETDLRLDEHRQINDYLVSLGFELTDREREVRTFISDTAGNCLYDRAVK